MADSRVFPANTLLWDNPELKGKPVLALSTDTPLDVYDGCMISQEHSIMYLRYQRFRCRIDGRDFWISPTYKLHAGAKGGVIDVVRSPVPLFFMAGFLLVALFLALWRIRSKKPWGGKGDFWRLALFLILCHFAWISFLRWQIPHLYFLSWDVREYFTVAQGIISMSMVKMFYFTIGLPLFYIPVILLTDAKVVTDIDIPISYFFSFVIMPLNFLLFMDIIRRYSKSVLLGGVAILSWLVITKILMAVELPKPTALLSLFGMFHSEYIFGCYQYVLHGFNPGSEPWSLFTVFSSVWLIGRLPAGRWRYFLVAALYGYACTVRLNNIWFAPLLAFLFWHEDKSRLLEWPYLLRMLTLSIISFFLFFCPQLLVNYLEFGNCMSFPYVLHGAQINAGFEHGNVPRVADFYLRWHALLYAMFIPALLLIRDKLLQRVLVLWTIPLMIFFCGYSFAAEPYRFLMPLFWAMTAAVFASQVLKNTSWQVKILFVSGLILLAIPELPVSFVIVPGDEPLCYRLSPLLQTIHVWRSWYFIPLVVGLCLLLRAHRRIVFFLLAYALLLCCPWQLFFFSMALILLYVIQGIIREYWRSRFQSGDSADGTDAD